MNSVIFDSECNNNRLSAKFTGVTHCALPDFLVGSGGGDHGDRKEKQRERREREEGNGKGGKYRGTEEGRTREEWTSFYTITTSPASWPPKLRTLVK